MASELTAHRGHSADSNRQSSFSHAVPGSLPAGAFFVNMLFREAMERAKRKWRRSLGGLLVPA